MIKAEISHKVKEVIRKPIESFTNKIMWGDALSTLKKLPEDSIDCIVTSPPYFNLRDYKVAWQIGLERSFNEYIEKLLAVFDEARRVLKPSGICWIVIGDTYGGSATANQLVNKAGRMRNIFNRSSPNSTHTKGRYAKCLLQIPARLALGMIERGWILRNEIIWHKPNCLPSSAADRFTVDFEKLFFFVKSRKYYFNQQLEPLRDKNRLTRPMFDSSKNQKYRNMSFSAINHQNFEKSRVKMLERDSRNKRSVWTIGTTNFDGNHFAVYPPRLIETPIKAGCPAGGIVLDPFIGSGTTAIVTKKLGRKFIGIELNPEYVKIANQRILRSQ